MENLYSNHNICNTLLLYLGQGKKCTATLVASVGLKKLEFNISSKENSMIARIIACQEHRMQCFQFFRRANFRKKTGAILAKIRAKRRAKLKFFVILSSFCDLNHQQFSEINGSF